ncbi:MAG: hypothetical protein ABI844_04905 [Saprospiraceae bacterium]
MNSSRLVLIISMVVMAYASLWYYPKWKMTRTEATLSWDVSGYYLYLPALFIYHDIKELKFKSRIDSIYYPSSSPYQSFVHSSGNQVMKYTCGLAVLYSPFFLMAHLLAKPLGYIPDGYSQIYQLFISIGSLVWAFIGLFFLRRLLLIYFKDVTVAFSLAILILGTNYLDYASITGAMSHNYLFSLYSILLFSIDRYYNSLRKVWFLLACLLIGLMVLIRPTEIISVFLLFLWNIDTTSALKQRVNYFIHHTSLSLVGILAFFIFPLVQIYYWKFVSGEWLVYSYQEQGFSWLEGHHILQGLFSYRAGWLVYTPIMILVLIGMIKLGFSRITGRWLFIGFILLSLYLTFAWDEWTYGGSLGQRALIQHYPIMIFPICFLLGDIVKIRPLLYVFVLFASFCIYYNLWLTHQAHKGGIYEAGMMNKAYFWNTLFKNENLQENKKLLDTNEPVYEFNDDAGRMIIDTIFHVESTCANNSNSVSLYSHQMQKGKLKVELLAKASLKEWDVWQMAQLVIQYQKDNKSVKSTILRLHRFLNDNDEKWISLVTKSPAGEYDKLNISIWNPSNKNICIKELKLFIEN